MNDRPVIYLDYQASTPTDPRVVQAMLPYFTDVYGNPSSSHALGRRASDATEAARRKLRDLVGAEHDNEIVFTSGATEANHLAIAGTAHALRDRGNHIITSAIEHKSVLATCQQLAHEGFQITVLPVGPDGIVDPAHIEAAITSHTVLVSIMHANNEIGTIQPLAQIATITRSRNVPLHTDAAQSIGTVPADFNELGVDLASISGHKMYAPKGIGAIYIRRGSVRPIPYLIGGGQEYGLRAGTPNVPGIVGLGAAAAILRNERAEDAHRLHGQRERLRDRLERAVRGLRVNGSLVHRLPGNLNVTIPGVDAADLIARLSDIALSTGSACNTGQGEPSHVLTALGLSRTDARATLRISPGRFTTDDEIEVACIRLRDEVNLLAAAS